MLLLKWVGVCIRDCEFKSVMSVVTAALHRPELLCAMQISPISTGRINMQYRRVQCVPPGKMSVVIDNNVGTNGWLRMFVSVSLLSLSLLAIAEPRQTLLAVT